MEAHAGPSPETGPPNFRTGWEAGIVCFSCVRHTFDMFRNAHFDRLRQAFGDQFTTDDHGVIYRRYQKGAPVRISEVERKRFIIAFNNHLKYATWSIFPATVGLILLLVLITPNANSPSAQLTMWVGLVVILVPFLIYFRWAWNHPSRELKRRAPEGAALTKEQARALAFSKITYGQLALAALMGAGMVWKMSMRFDVLHGWGMIWLLFGAGLIVIAGIQAIRKWRFNQQRASK